MKKYEYEIAGLDCAACANEIQEGLNKNPEIKNANVNFAKMKLTYETDTLSKEEIEKIVQGIEPEVELLEVNSKSKDLKNEKAQKENRKKLWLHILRLVIGAIVAGVGLYVPMPKVASTILIVLGYAILLFKTVKNAVKLLFKSKTINENLLITISCIGAYLVGKSSEGLMVIILYEIGKILEEKAINKTRKSISDLMDIKPEYANLKKGDEIEIVVQGNQLLQELTHPVSQFRAKDGIPYILVDDQIDVRFPGEIGLQLRCGRLLGPLVALGGDLHAHGILNAVKHL